MAKNKPKRQRKHPLKGLGISLFSLFMTLAVGALLVSVILLVYSGTQEWVELQNQYLRNRSFIGYLFLGILVALPILLIVLFRLNSSRKAFRSASDLKLQRWSKTLLVFVTVFCYLEAEIWYYTISTDGTSYLALLFVSHLLLLPILIVYMVIVNARRQKTVRVLKKTIKLQASIITQKNAEEKRRLEEEERRRLEAVAEPRFSMLREIDERRGERQGLFRGDYEEVSLKEFCDEFRSFAANRLGLYYEISDIRRFVAGIAVSKILILQGMSGTGKTSLAYALGEFLGNPSTVIPVQPMWKERTDLLGYYNEFTKRFNETLLLQKMYEANYSEDIYITILDELNIARVEYYFAEFLSLLEIPNPEGRWLEVVSDHWENDPKQLREGRIKLPENMWFIGTANNDDSTFAISDKVYDRAMVLNLDRKSEPFETMFSRNVRISAKQFEKLVQESQEGYEITRRNMRRIGKLDAYLVDKFQITFGNRIMKQIRNYVPVFVDCGGDEIEALDDIIMKKVLRKLESLNSVYVRSMSEELCNFLDDLFGVDKMPTCKEYIRRIARNA